MVFTSNYVKNPKTFPKCDMLTFNGVADYGIYCITHTIDKRTTICFTLSTNQINFSKLVKIIDEKYEYKVY